MIKIKNSTFYLLVLLFTMSFRYGYGQQYCTAKTSSPSFMYIANVTFGDINNNSTYNSQGYSDFTNISTNLIPGTTYDFSILTGGPYNQYYVAWIDFNQDGIFTSNERLFYEDNLNHLSVSQSLSVTIPSDAQLGQTRLRVISNYYAYSNGNQDNQRPFMQDLDLINYEGCGKTSEGSWEYGDVEDYTVNITTGGSTADGLSAMYTYDNAGNRRARQIQVNILDEQDDMLTDIRSKTKPSDKMESTDWSVFPNPVSDRLFVKSESVGDLNFNAIIYDMTGRELLQKNFTINGVFDFSQLQSGTYILTVSAEGGKTKYWKVVKN